MTRARVWAAIAALSLVLHLRGITAPPWDYHYHRQANTAAIARNYERNGLHFFTPQIDWDGANRGRAATEFPLYMWLTGLFWPLFSLGEIWGRVLSSVFSAATAVYLYELLLALLGREREKEALAGALVFCCLPLEIYFGRTIQPEALALWATVASMYHWDRSLESPRSWLHWTAAVVLAFLAVAHKIPYAYFLVALAALAHLKLGKKAWTDPRVLLAPVLALGAVFAWYKYASSGTYVVPTHEDQIFSVLDYRNLPHYVWFQFSSRFPELSATYAGVLLGALGARELWKRRSLLFFWWFAAVCVYIVAGGAYTHYHEYTSLPFAPINAAFIGVGLVGLWKKSPVWAGLLALAIPVHAHGRINHWYKTSYPFLADAGAAAAQVSAPDDLFVTNDRAASLYLYFLDRRGWSWDWNEGGTPRPELLADAIKNGAKFYATEASRAPEYISSSCPVVFDNGILRIYRLTARESSASRPSRSSRPARR